MSHASPVKGCRGIIVVDLTDNIMSKLTQNIDRIFLSDSEKKEIRQTFIEYLKTHDMRATPERIAILDEIYTTDFHFEADDILTRVRAKGIKASRATIYRTIEILEKCGLIRKARFGEIQAYYEHTFGRHHHEHMRCTQCGKVIEFLCPEIEELQDEICKQHDFKMTNHILHLFGVCADCHN